MLENEFERQVSNTMSTYEFTPSEAVWTEVAKTLPPTRKRRIVVFWILLFLGFGGLGYWWWTSAPTFAPTSIATASGSVENKEESTSSTTIETTSTNRSNVDSIGIQQRQGVQTGATSNTPSSVSNFVQAKSEAITRSKDEQLKSSSNLLTNSTNTRKLKGRSRSKVVAPAADVQDNSSEFILAEPNTATEPTGVPTQTMESVKILNNDLVDETAPLSPTAKLSGDDKAIVQKDTIKALLDTNTLNNKTITVQQQKESKKRLQWYLQVSVGVGSAGQSLLSDNQVNSPITTGGVISVPVNVSTPIRSGFGAQLGLECRYPLSSRIFLLSGLGYQYRSCRMPLSIVTANSISNNQFYTLGNSQTYTHQFHSIQLPLMMGIPLGKTRGHDWQLLAGVQLNYLLQSNALQYDNQSNRYLQDDGLITAFQTSLSASVLFSLRRSQRTPLYLGFETQYGLNTIAASGLFGNAHMGYAGLSLRKMLGKNKTPK